MAVLTADVAADPGKHPFPFISWFFNQRNFLCQLMLAFIHFTHICLSWAFKYGAFKSAPVKRKKALRQRTIGSKIS